MKTGIQDLEIQAFAPNHASTPVKINPQDQQSFCGELKIPANVSYIQVRMTFPNRNLIPPSIAREMRQDDEMVDLFHAQKHLALTGDQDHIKEGRVRPDRSDTGNQVIKNIGEIHLGVVRRGLAANGFGLIDAKCQTRRKPTRPGQRQQFQSIVVLKFVRDAKSVELTPELAEAIRQLAKISWTFLHLWDNSNSMNSATINVVGPQAHAKPKRALVVRDGTIKVVEEEVSEDKE